MCTGKSKDKYDYIAYITLPDLSIKALVAADISACWMLWPTPVASLSCLKYTATVYRRVLVGPIDSIHLKKKHIESPHHT